MASKATAKLSEYDRAKTDYERLLRHRLANPISVILGMSRTLLDHQKLPKGVWVELVEHINNSAETLKEVCFDERPLDHIERGLDGRVHHKWHED